MANTVESDEEPEPTTMDVDKSGTPPDTKDPDDEKKKSKAPLVPFFESRPGYTKTFLSNPASIKIMAQLTLEELRAYDTRTYPSDVVEVAKMYARGVTQDEIDKFVLENNIDVDGTEFYKPIIPIDPDVDRDKLEQTAETPIIVHPSLQDRYCCDILHEFTAKKTAATDRQSVMCLAYGEDKKKVTTGNIDSVFGPKVGKPDTTDAADTTDTTDAADADEKRTTGKPTKKKMDIDGYIKDLEHSHTQSGYVAKVAMYHKGMEMDPSGPLANTTLEEMLTDAWCYAHDRDADARRKFLEKDDDDEKTKEKKSKLQEKEKEKKEELDAHVKAESQKLREIAMQKNCEIRESTIKKAAALKLARNSDFKKGSDKYNAELAKLEELLRKDMKAKLIPKSDKAQLEKITKKTFHLSLRRKRLKGSQIVCPKTYTSYTPLTNKCPIGGAVNITTAHLKTINRAKSSVANKYAIHANKMSKKGICIKIFA